jgi:hypothetical protein
VKKSGENVAGALWVGAIALIILGPSYLIYKTLKRKKGSNALPVAAAIGLPLAYFSYASSKREREREQRQQAGESTK